MAITGPAARIVKYRECPGMCGRDDVKDYDIACQDCLDRLPRSLKQQLLEVRQNGSLAVQMLPVLARMKIYWENRMVGV